MSLRERLRRHRNGGSASNGAGGAKDAGSPAQLADVASGMASEAQAIAGFEVVVPIELGTELMLAAAAAKPAAQRASEPAPSSVSAQPASAAEDLRLDILRRLIDRLDVEALGKCTDERQLADQIRSATDELLRAANSPLSASEREQIVEQMVHEVAGLGPIEPLFRDPTVTDILVNGAKNVFVERSGRLSRVKASFRNDAHLLTVIDRVVSRAGRRVDERSPIVDARLPDGSQVNAIIPPLALNGPVLSIRRPSSDLSIEMLTTNGTLTGRMATLLAACVQGRLNVVISGGSGSGKTTLLNALSAFIPATERVVTIEETAELRPKREHVVRLETRPPSVEGRNEVSARDLLRHAVRMRPSRLLIGELQGMEALDLLQAMSAGLEGSMATLHANSPSDAVSRLEHLVMLAGTSLPMRAVREQLARAVDVIVQVARLSDGRRRVVSITEVTGIEGGTVALSEIFTFRRSGILGGRVLGRFEATGVRPRFAEQLQVGGMALPPRLFEASTDSDEGAPSGIDAVLSPFASGTGPHDAGAADDRLVRTVKQLEAAVGVLESSLEQERRATQEARADVEEMRAQVVSARQQLDALYSDVRSAQHEAEEQREIQAMLQQRSRSLAVAVLGFVEMLDETVDAADRSADESMHDRAQRLRDGVARLLALFGLSEINDVGGPVDETHHEVVGRVTSNGHSTGTVVTVVQRGFAYHGHLVRRAQVVVAE